MYSSQVGAAEARQKLLLKIYRPFQKYSRESVEYKELARSGKVWEDYHRPYDSLRKGYLDIQRENSYLLQEIDSLAKFMKLEIPDISKTLVAEHAHQSVAIEDNRSNISDAVKVDTYLAAHLFNVVNEHDFSKLSVDDLPKIGIPRSEPDTHDIVELKNHIVASRWIAENAARQQNTPGLTEKEVRVLQIVSCKGTNAELAHALSWGKRIDLGDYHVTPIRVKSNPLSIFPYPAEIAACVRRFFEWRDKAHADHILHPLVLACQAQVYFAHIHPFLDGNGRVSRMIGHDYMARHGYLPVIMQHICRKDFLRMIRNAQDGKPRELITSVILTQLDELRSFYWNNN
ncbi:fic/DOC family protein [Seiridium cupressi]